MTMKKTILYLMIFENLTVFKIFVHITVRIFTNAEYLLNHLHVLYCQVIFVVPIKTHILLAKS